METWLPIAIVRYSSNCRFVPKAEMITVVRRPGADTLVDGCHRSYGNENDRYQCT